MTGSPWPSHLSPLLEAGRAAPPEAARILARHAAELATLNPPPEGLPELRAFVAEVGAIELGQLGQLDREEASGTVAEAFHRRTGWRPDLDPGEALLDAFGAFAMAAGLHPLPDLPPPPGGTARRGAEAL